MLPSTALLQPRYFYRLVVQNTSPWWALLSSATYAQGLFENLASYVPAFPAAPPSSPVNDVWVQDISMGSEPGNLTVGQLIQALTDRFSWLTVLDLHQLPSASIGGNNTNAQVERDQETQQVAQQQQQKTDAQGTWWGKLTDLFKQARAILALLLAIAVVWYVGPWIAAGVRAWQKRKTS